MYLLTVPALVATSHTPTSAHLTVHISHRTHQTKKHRMSEQQSREEAKQLERHFESREKVNVMAAKARLNTTLAQQYVRLLC